MKQEATRLADALERMDALLKPALGFLTVPYNSATAQAAVIDMGTIRVALRDQSARILELEAALNALRRLIDDDDDAHAMTFQTLGQYRSALLAAIKEAQR